MEARERLILALDGVQTLDEIRARVRLLSPWFATFKVGLQAFLRLGKAAVEAVLEEGGAVFLDLKLHDIPHTVSGAVAEVAGLGAQLLTVHACGGLAMLRAAVEQAPELDILGVTVLTSLDDAALSEELGIAQRAAERVPLLAQLCQRAGTRGVIASPREVEAIRACCGSDLLVITPGIRPEWAVAGDQRRIATPTAALRAGADQLVIGRAVSQPPAPMTPLEAAQRICAEVAAFEDLA